MNRPNDGVLEFSGQRLRLSTLVRLRWLAIVGQTVTVLVVGLWFGFPVPFLPCFALILLSAAVNVGLKYVFTSERRLDHVWGTAVLGYDILQLSGLLYLTGGLENPFAVLLLFPAVVSATTMQPDKTFLLGGLVASAATVLTFVHRPVPWFAGETLDLPLLYVVGVWIALVSGLVFIAFYAFRVADEARQLSNALAATELTLQREQHLSALDGLAAAAAHELGTPLSTITLVAGELADELDEHDNNFGDISLIVSQAKRCREILGKLTSMSSAPEEHLGRMPLSLILEEVAAPHRDFGIVIRVTLDGADPEPIAPRNAGLLYGLGNLVENAVDYARKEVAIRASWTSDLVNITITDDGPGFAGDIVDRLGEPYVTTRHTGLSRGSEGDGLGLGFFIARILLGRGGGQIRVMNRSGQHSGAIVSVSWNRADFDAAADPEGGTAWNDQQAGGLFSSPAVSSLGPGD